MILIHTEAKMTLLDYINALTPFERQKLRAEIADILLEVATDDSSPYHILHAINDEVTHD